MLAFSLRFDARKDSQWSSPLCPIFYVEGQFLEGPKFRFLMRIISASTHKPSSPQHRSTCPALRSGFELRHQSNATGSSRGEVFESYTLGQGVGVAPQANSDDKRPGGRKSWLDYVTQPVSFGILQLGYGPGTRSMEECVRKIVKEAIDIASATYIGCQWTAQTPSRALISVSRRFDILMVATTIYILESRRRECVESKFVILAFELLTLFFSTGPARESTWTLNIWPAGPVYSCQPTVANLQLPVYSRQSTVANLPRPQLPIA